MRFVPVIILTALALVALVLTQAATFQSPHLAEWFVPLLAADGVLILIIFAAVCAMALRIAADWRKNAPGGRLALRLGGVLLAVALLPSVLLYGVSTAGIFRSIDSWFATPLGRAFEQGEAFGKSVLEGEFAGLETVARDMAGNLGGRDSLPFWVEDFRLFHQLDGVALYDNSGRALATSGKGEQERLSGIALEALQAETSHRDLTGGGIAVVLRLPSGAGAYAVRLVRPLPAELLAGLREVELGQREYNNLLAVRRGLRLSFLITLTLAFFMILLAAAAAALWLGRRLAHPLVTMADATAAVGHGDFSRRLPESGSDEIARLNRAFNAMVDDLADSRRTLDERQAALTKANLYLENLLASLTSGVLVFDDSGKLARANDGASRLLQTDMRKFIGAKIRGNAAIAAINETIAAADYEVQERRIAGPADATLVARTRRLPPEAGGAALVVIVDITRQMREEREAAWEEASRRFAHEIKNPLTPIRLAAERLGRKLAAKLPTAEKETLARLVTTIVNQVDAMRQMVDSFRDTGGEQKLLPEPVDLASLVREVARLYERADLRLILDLPNETRPVAATPLALRQVLHNLLSNADAAVSRMDKPHIHVSAVFLADAAVLTVTDNGGGLPEEVAGKIFEPYVTTKPGGTGLGLSEARKALTSMNGSITVKNHNKGARAQIRLPLHNKTPKDE
ncbi:MAG: ATP-binding protein [Gammaproteobacteria bacterium]